MASGIQLGAGRARFSWDDIDTIPTGDGWSGGYNTLPVVDYSHGPNQKVYVGFHPFASHVIVADSFQDAYESYIEAIEHLLALDDGDVATINARIEAGENFEDVLASWDAITGPSGSIIVDYMVTLTEVPLSAICWLAPLPVNVPPGAD